MPEKASTVPLRSHGDDLDHLGRELRQLCQGVGCIHHLHDYRMSQVGAAFGRFFAVRGTHLAAMVAYFALASFVPLVFLSLALLGLLGRVDESTALVAYLQDVFPGVSLDRIVSVVGSVQDNARTLGLVGGVALLWSSLSLFSALESAFNIVYDRPNRSFLRGKALASVSMVALLVVLFTGLGVGTFGTDLLRRYAPDVIANHWASLGLTAFFSMVALFLFLLAAYYRLTNASVTRREALPGAIVASFVVMITLQGLPLFVEISSGVLALQALGATFLLLLWLYVMANVIVFGSVLNWQLAHGRTGIPVRPRYDTDETTDEDTADDRARVAPRRQAARVSTPTSTAGAPPTASATRSRIEAWARSSAAVCSSAYSSTSQPESPRHAAAAIIVSSPHSRRSATSVGSASGFAMSTKKLPPVAMISAVCG